MYGTCICLTYISRRTVTTIAAITTINTAMTTPTAIPTVEVELPAGEPGVASGVGELGVTTIALENPASS